MVNTPSSSTNRVSRTLLSYLSHEMMNRFNVLLTFSENLCKSDQLHEQDRVKAERLVHASREAYQTAMDVVYWRKIFEMEEQTSIRNMGTRELNQLIYDLSERFDDVELIATMKTQSDWSFQFNPSHLKTILEFSMEFIRTYDHNARKVIRLELTENDDSMVLVLNPRTEHNAQNTFESRCKEALEAKKPYDSLSLGLQMIELLTEINRCNIHWNDTVADFYLRVKKTL